MWQPRRGNALRSSRLPSNRSGLQDVVRTRVILTNIEDWKAATAVRKEYFRDVRPVDTIIAVTRFVNPEWLVEFEADAIIADRS